ncbi:hypothetical protein OH784_10015 [Ectobacillus funiculus]|uniref:hypothetical protein n=1 Tax=Ectobacillus funiculus TaxID=137993 RepID=UPI003978180D
MNVDYTIHIGTEVYEKVKAYGIKFPSEAGFFELYVELATAFQDLRESTKFNDISVHTVGDLLQSGRIKDLIDNTHKRAYSDFGDRVYESAMSFTCERLLRLNGYDDVKELNNLLEYDSFVTEIGLAVYEAVYEIPLSSLEWNIRLKK